MGRFAVVADKIIRVVFEPHRGAAVGAVHAQIIGRNLLYRYKMVWILLLTSFQAQQYDVIVRGGTVYDGSGGAPVLADVGIRKDRIEASAI